MPPNDLIDTAERLVRVETKIDFLIKHVENLPPNPNEKMEERITKLETFVNRAVGAMVTINVIITFFAYKLKGFI
ncbi:hypothetical protein UFOVP1087_18 [uncultured Caudovirales phage]|uniref:Uncharacterized protein n=1 Tax=uncultured Caudovirales phage TaxID=2100421 RepID=A0A6J5QD57_9CAUD|nr:hypothetical protein UFOVP910_33 [uncultured Caudovirales phage]CAB4182690.1 hypothetical protein UFOVP1087_18 [uncultured Caudovirales phage]CAB5228228.1 hypothetical protein UFOVP1534_28 [uncultured Caudovirales phage]